MFENIVCEVENDAVQGDGVNTVGDMSVKTRRPGADADRLAGEQEEQPATRGESWWRAVKLREERLRHIYEQEIADLERDYKHILTTEIKQSLAEPLSHAEKEVRGIIKHTSTSTLDCDVRQTTSSSTQTIMEKRREFASQTKKSATQVDKATSSWDLHAERTASITITEADNPCTGSSALTTEPVDGLDPLADKMVKLSSDLESLRIRVQTCDQVLRDTAAPCGHVEVAVFSQGPFTPSSTQQLSEPKSERNNRVKQRRHRRRRHQYRRHR